MPQEIEHTGIITNISGNNIQVQIQQSSACSKCHAKSACSAADKTEKIIDVVDITNQHKVGDTVVIFADKALGIRAILLAFIIPFILILATLLVCRFFSLNEIIPA